MTDDAPDGGTIPVDEPTHIVHLASGVAVLVLPDRIEIQPGELDRAPDITQLRAIKSVTRIDNDLTIRRVRQRTLQITLTSPEDAALLETRIHEALAAAPLGTPGGALGIVGRAASWLPLGMLVCALLVVVGSFGPWAKTPFHTVSGFDWDGSITLIFGVIAGALAVILMLQPWRRGWVLGLLMATFGLAALVGLTDWMDVGRVIEDIGIDARVSWGLQLMTVAAGIGFTLASIQYMRRSAPVSGLRGRVADDDQE
jgi:hypothetical protein